MTRFLLLLLLTGCSVEAETGPPSPPLLRVRLASLAAADRVRLRVPGPYRLVRVADGSVVESGSDLDRDVAVRGSSVPEPLRMLPGKGFFALAGRTYEGTLLVQGGPEGAVLVVETDLESYLPGVLAGELGPGFHAAALRAQAVAARSYALSRRRERGEAAAWHVSDDVTDQVFAGRPPPEATALVDAVRRTRGMVLLRGSRPLRAFFCSTCGGHTASAGEVFHRPEIPPLVGVPCGFCSISPRFRWILRLPLEEVQSALALPGPPLAARVKEHGRDGRVRTVSFDCPEPVALSGTELRARLGPRRLPGTRIHRLKIEARHLVAEGGGYGHGVGMCQWGAEGMARAGASAGDILAYYYPGAVLGRVY